MTSQEVVTLKFRNGEVHVVRWPNGKFEIDVAMGRAYGMLTRGQCQKLIDALQQMLCAERAQVKTEQEK